MILPIWRKTGNFKETQKNERIMSASIQKYEGTGLWQWLLWCLCCLYRDIELIIQDIDPLHLQR